MTNEGLLKNLKPGEYNVRVDAALPYEGIDPDTGEARTVHCIHVKDGVIGDTLLVSRKLYALLSEAKWTPGVTTIRQRPPKS